ncbi:PfkB family carbohydrate kinase [Litorisediminicola beolgyonensis]|uniref:PfkB family carbohydrate kinase n=1 Tax=Litorisediminicola beolgyonensis TaxID=1173614 RepID=A0ABW3ZHW3_9RHOB
MTTAQVICAGIVTVDLVFSTGAEVALREKNRALASRMVPGGCALNAAFAIARLGGRATLAGMTGDDPFGDWLRQEVAAAGVDARLLGVRPGVTTSRSAVLVAPDGERTIINDRPEALYAEGLSDVDLGDAGAVLTDTRWPSGATDLLAAARAAGLPGVIDAEAPVGHAGEALRLASHIAFSEQGLAEFAGGADAAALARAARDLGCWVCVTRGPAPVICHDGTELTEQPTFPVTAVDTLGAGDVWHGAFALALAEGRPEAEAVRFANAAGALKTTRRGGADDLPDRTEILRLMEDYPR